jgi:hypothetical protein
MCVALVLCWESRERSGECLERRREKEREDEITKDKAPKTERRMLKRLTLLENGKLVEIKDELGALFRGRVRALALFQGFKRRLILEGLQRKGGRGGRERRKSGFRTARQRW